MPKIKIALKPAVACIRMSSDHQEGSPDQQREELQKLAKEFGYKIIREYFDSGISGADTKKRKAFKQMISDAETLNDFEVILCWDQDRFGRFDPVEANYYWHILREAGVYVHTVAQGIIDISDLGNWLKASITQHAKAQFLVDLSRNCSRGFLKSAKQGKPLGGRRYAYDRMYMDEKGQFVKRVSFLEKFSKPVSWSSQLVPSEVSRSVETLRWIFETWVNSERSPNSIAVELNEKGIPSATGGLWNGDSVRGILKNQVYVGDMIWGKESRGKFHRLGRDGEFSTSKEPKKRVHVTPPIIVENTHEALIDRETFAKAQLKFSERTRDLRKPRVSPYVLTGVMECGHCGGPMVGFTYSEKLTYYRCSSLSRGLGCGTRSIRKDLIESYLLKLICDEVLSESKLNRLKQSIVKHGKTQSIDDSISEDEKLLKQLDRDILRANKNLLRAGDRNVEDAYQLLDELKEQQKVIRRRLNASRRTKHNPVTYAERAIAELSKLKRILVSSDPCRVRHVLRLVLSQVTVWVDRPRRLANSVVSLVEIKLCEDGLSGFLRGE